MSAQLSVSGLSSALILTALLATSPAKADVFHAQSFTLGNGMQIVIVPGALAPAVTQMVWYKVGSADDPDGQSGLAHYLEHMMFKGTDAMPPGSFSALIAAEGGEDNAFTDTDATAYYVSIASDRLPLIMALEADRMRNLKVDPQEALSERSVVASERQQRTGNDPQGAFQERLMGALFPNHPYGRPVIGWEQEIQKLTPDELRAFYKIHYAPNNAILVISGDADPQKVLAAASATFGRLAPEQLPPRKPLPLPEATAEKRIVVSDARVTQPIALREIAAPSYSTAPARTAAFEVLNEALGNGEVSLLYRTFVRDKQTASAIETSYAPAARGPALFVVASTPSSKASVEDLEADVNATLDAYAKKGLPAAEIQSAKQRLIDSAIFARDSLTAPARSIGEVLAAGGDLNAIEDLPAKIKAVTPREVNEALRELLASKNQVSGLLKPQETEAAHE